MLKETVLEESKDIIQKLSESEFRDVLYLLSNKKEALNPMSSVVIFVRGLNENNYFSFREFIKGLTNGSS
jgi:hypothetical protein